MKVHRRTVRTITLDAGQIYEALCKAHDLPTLGDLGTVFFDGGGSAAPSEITIIANDVYEQEIL